MLFNWNIAVADVTIEFTQKTANNKIYKGQDTLYSVVIIQAPIEWINVVFLKNISFNNKLVVYRNKFVGYHIRISEINYKQILNQKTNW